MASRAVAQKERKSVAKFQREAITFGRSWKRVRRVQTGIRAGISGLFRRNRFVPVVFVWPGEWKRLGQVCAAVECISVLSTSCPPSPGFPFSRPKSTFPIYLRARRKTGLDVRMSHKFPKRRNKIDSLVRYIAVHFNYHYEE